MTRLARDGVWTPWAQVLCVECDYQYGLKNPRWQTSHPGRWEALCKLDRTALIEQPDGDELAKCDACRCDCWVRFDVAVCQRVGQMYSELSWDMDDVRAGFEMEQTGGMCCAATFPVTNDDDRPMGVVVVTAMDGGVYVGRYHRAEEPLTEPIDWNDPVEAYEHEFATVDGEFVDVERAIEIGARTVIEFVRRSCKELNL